MPNKQSSNYNLAPARNHDKKHTKKASDGTMSFMLWSIAGTALVACSGGGGGGSSGGGGSGSGSGSGSSIGGGDDSASSDRSGASVPNNVMIPVMEGGEVVLTEEMFPYTGDDIRYSILVSPTTANPDLTSPIPTPKGTIERQDTDGNWQEISSAFTLEDVRAGNIRFNHNGDEQFAIVDGYRGTAAEATSIVFLFSGDEIALDAVTADLIVEAVNDAPVRANAGNLFLAEGGIEIITTALLRFNDVDNTAVELTYTITNAPEHGTLLLGERALGDETFTQADIDEGRVRYEHNGREEERDSFTYSVRDGAEAGSSTNTMGSFSITITGTNDAPTATETTSPAPDKAVTESGHDDAGALTFNAATDAQGSGAFTHGDDDVGQGDFTGGTPEAVAGDGSTSMDSDYEAGTGGDGTAIIGEYGTLYLLDLGTWRYELNNAVGSDADALDEGETVMDSFLIRIRDDAAPDDATRFSEILPIVITITGTNDRPTITTTDSTTGTRMISDTSRDSMNTFTPLTGTAQAQDPDADDGDDTNDFTWEGTLQDTALARFVSSFEITPSTSVNAQGDWSFTPDETAFNALNHGQRQELVYDIRVTDRQGAVSEKSTLTITLEGAEDAPTLVLVDTQTPRAKERGGHNNNQRVTSATSGTLAAALTGAVAMGAFAYDDADAADTGFGAGGTVQGRHSTDTDADYEDGGTGNGMNIAGTYGTLSLRADGSWEYVLNEANTAVQALNDGEMGVLSETFQFRIKDIVGSSSNNIYSNVITIDIDIEGTNDAPELTVDNAAPSGGYFVREDVSAQAMVTDTLTFSDIDVEHSLASLTIGASTTRGDVEDEQVRGASTEITTGSVDIAGDYGTFEVSRDSAGQITWVYRIDNARANGLGQYVASDSNNANNRAIETLYIRVWDDNSTTGNGLASDIVEIRVEVRGLNDAPTAGETANPDKAVRESGYNEAGDDEASGTISHADVDMGQGDFTGGRVQGRHSTDADADYENGGTGTDIDGEYGTLYLLADGTWRYELGNARSNVQQIDGGDTPDVIMDHFLIRIEDTAPAGENGNETLYSNVVPITITITGTNDAPVITNTDSKTFVDPDATGGIAVQSIMGEATASDVDADDNTFTWTGILQDATGKARFATDASLVFTGGGANGGAWEFTPDAAAFNALTHGQQETLIYSVQASDPQDALSAAQDLVIILEGVDDAATNLRLDGAGDLETQRAGGAAPADTMANGLLQFDDVDGDVFGDSDVFIRGAAGQSPNEANFRDGDDAALDGDGNQGTPIEGTYGVLFLKNDGTWTYVLDENDEQTLLLENGDFEMDTFSLHIQNRISGSNVDSQPYRLDITVRSYEVIALTAPTDDEKQVFYDTPAAGRATAMTGAVEARGTTSYAVVLSEDDAFVDGQTMISDDLADIVIEADGSWTYTLTSLSALNVAAMEAGLGNTLDSGEVLMRTFYIKAMNDEVQAANRAAMLEVDVIIRGMDIRIGGGLLNEMPGRDEVFVGGDTHADTFNPGDGRNLILGNGGSDRALLESGGEDIIYHRMESDGDAWVNIDGLDFVAGFKRNEDKFILIDIDATPISEDDFLASDTPVTMIADLSEDENSLISFSIEFAGSLPIFFIYDEPITITSDNEADFFGVGRSGITEITEIGLTGFEVTDRSLWRHFFGDDEDDFQIVDILPELLNDIFGRRSPELSMLSDVTFRDDDATSSTNTPMLPPVAERTISATDPNGNGLTWRWSPTDTEYGTFNLEEISENEWFWSFDFNAEAINRLDENDDPVVLNFFVNVTDSLGGRDVTSLAITLIGTNDAPEEMVSSTLSVAEGGIERITTALLRFNDVDNTAAELTYTIINAPEHGTFLLAGRTLGDRTFTQADIDAERVQYWHDGHEDTSDSFTYSVRDGVNTVSGSFNIDIVAINDAPTITETTSPEPDKAVTESGHDDDGVAIFDAAMDAHGSGVFTHSDPDSPRGTPEVALAGSTDYMRIMDGSATISSRYGTLTLTDGAWSYALNNAAGSATDMLNEDDEVTDSFKIRIRDDGDEVSDDIDINIVITGTNDRPDITNVNIHNSMQSITDDSPNSIEGFFPLTGDARATDPDAEDGDETTDFIWQGTLRDPHGTLAQYGTFSFAPNNSGTWTFTPDTTTINALAQDEQRVLIYDITATDSRGAVSEAEELTITITGIDDLARLVRIPADEDILVRVRNNLHRSQEGYDPGDPFASGSLLLEDVDSDVAEFRENALTMAASLGAQAEPVDLAASEATGGITAVEGNFGTLYLNNNDTTWIYRLDNSRVTQEAVGDLFFLRSKDTRPDKDGVTTFTIQLGIAIRPAITSPNQLNSLTMLTNSDLVAQYDTAASGRVEVMRGADTSPLYVVTEDIAYVATLQEGSEFGIDQPLDDNGIGRIEIEDDGSWTYTLTSLSALNAAAMEANLGNTLDSGEILTRVFYIHARQASNDNRLATLRVEVEINGMDVRQSDGIPVNGIAGKDEIFVGSMAVDTFHTGDGSDIVIGLGEADMINLGAGQDTIYHRVASTGSQILNTDGADTISGFSRDDDTFILVDVDDNPIAKVDFIMDTQVLLYATIQADQLTGFELRFMDDSSHIRFEYETNIDISGANANPFFGDGGIDRSATTIEVSDHNLWGHFFGDDEDGLQVIDELPPIIADLI